jgi:DNA-binding winged helix-turn-helix (wHTH) protein/predicted ATPase
MSKTRLLSFGPFRLDLGDERLWRQDEVIRLTPKALSVLRCLVTEAGQLVTKERLLEAVWPDTAVSESTLSGCVRELRRALGDHARQPQYIETVHGRGFRFISPVRQEATELTRSESDGGRQVLAPPPVSERRLLVGRESELERLHQWYARARAGTRQVGLITGEAGIGKTALLDAFVSEIAAASDVWVGHGQCIDQYGSGEAYLPVLEALGRLGRGADGVSLVRCLQQYAPSWLAQMPGLVSPEVRQALQQTAGGVTPLRMLRELAEALEVVTTERLLVLVFEDLHWSDTSTLEWLSYVSRRRDAARLMILGTYRPVEAIVRGHALRRVTQEMLQHGGCEELVLDYLSESSVGRYLSQRFTGEGLPEELTRALHQRSNGNPLFLTAIVDDLVRESILQNLPGKAHERAGFTALETHVPRSLRQLIEQQVEQLPRHEQEILEAASVAGAAFTTSLVAAGVDDAAERVEAVCMAWARRGQFVQVGGTESWPDGTVTACFSFIHALYQDGVYARVSPGRRVQLHRRLAERLESGYGERADELAALLALHYAHGQDASRAVPYYHRAAQNALARNGYQEAIVQAQSGLALLTSLDDPDARCRFELGLQRVLGVALVAIKGYAAPEVEQAFNRARELCQQAGETSDLFFVLAGLRAFHLARAEYQTALALSEQLLRLAQRLPDPMFRMGAHLHLGHTSLYLGALTRAQANFEQGLPLYDARHPAIRNFAVGLDSKVFCLANVALVLWLLGYPDQALSRSHEALSLARDLAQPFSLVLAHLHGSRIQAWRGDMDAAQDLQRVATTLATDHGITQRGAEITILGGWLLAAQGQLSEGRALMHEGLVTYRATGSEARLSYHLGHLAETYRYDAQLQEGLTVLDEALGMVEQNQEVYYHAELHRLKGELLLVKEGKPNPQAETHFRRALDLARRQQARSLELRAAMNLSQLWQQQGKAAQARELLAEVYGWFSEGFDTIDLQTARGLLDNLGEIGSHH